MVTAEHSVLGGTKRSRRMPFARPNAACSLPEGDKDRLASAACQSRYGSCCGATRPATAHNASLSRQ